MILFLLSLSFVAYTAYTGGLFRAKLAAIPAGINALFSRVDASPAGNDDGFDDDIDYDIDDDTDNDLDDLDTCVIYDNDLND